MKNQNNKNIKEKYDIRDLFIYIAFILIPLCFFIFNFVGLYKIFFYVILVVFILTYILVNQFFFENEFVFRKDKKILALMIVNTIIVSLITLSGNSSSSYFFLLPVLLFLTGILLSFETVILECIILLISIFASEIYRFGSISLFFSGAHLQNWINLGSLLALLPLAIGISLYIRTLEKRLNLMLIIRELLGIQDLEDEALLEEVEQGIIMLDRNLSIVKVSKWIEKNFETISRVLLGKRIQELEFYDAVSNRKLLPNDYFYKNLENETPQKLNWRLLYKNQYGKYEKFIIKQIPLKVQTKVIGFLLSVRFPPKSLQEMIGSYNQLACFRLSSQLAKLKNLCITSDEVKKSPQYYFIQKSLSQMTQLLNDNSIKTDLTEGNREIALTTFDLQVMLKNIIDSLRPSGNISLWTISPLLKNKPIILKSDVILCEMLITYSLKATLFFAKGKDINVNLDEDEISKSVILMMTTDCSSFPDVEHIELLEPFFQGKLIVLSKYEGSGLEISNANLIAKFLNFDFNAQINNAKLAIKITF